MSIISLVRTLHGQAGEAEERLDSPEAKAYNRGYRDALAEIIEYAEDREDDE